MSVSANTTRTVTVPVTFDAAGTYTVTVEDQPVGAMQVVARATDSDRAGPSETDSDIADPSETGSDIPDPSETNLTGLLLFTLMIVFIATALLWRRRSE